MDESGKTFFAPAGRKPASDVLSEHELIKQSSFFHALVDILPDPMVVLNPERQIVFTNHSYLRLAGASELSRVLGSRPGEALRCVNSMKLDAGCGTAEECRYCGIVQTILESQSSGKTVARECRILANKEDRNDAYDLMITASPFTLDGQVYTITHVKDISDMQRRRALERIFFHDLKNTVCGLKMLVECLKLGKSGDTGKIVSLMDWQSDCIIDEINSQYLLVQAENGELHLNQEEIQSLDMISKTLQSIESYPETKERKVIGDGRNENFRFASDPVLLRRIILNMVKNALEASPANSTITVGCRDGGGEKVFWVHNPGAMRREIQLQVFQRSFSTKGRGRGLGTYGMKLLGEQYLRGKVGFETSEEAGTRFFIHLP